MKKKKDGNTVPCHEHVCQTELAQDIVPYLMLGLCNYFECVILQVWIFFTYHNNHTASTCIKIFLINTDGNRT